MLDLSLIMAKKQDTEMKLSSRVSEYLQLVTVLFRGFFFLFVIFNMESFLLLYFCVILAIKQKKKEQEFLKIFNGFSFLRATSFVEFEYKIYRVRKVNVKL